MNAPMSRRQALFGIIGAGGTVVGALVPTASAEEHPAHPVAPLDAVAMLYDNTICTGCKACMVACSEVNGLPPDTSLSGGLWQMPSDLNSKTKNIIKLYQEPDGPGFAYVKKQCMHCLDPACVAGCPFDALKKNLWGAVTWDSSLCIGCEFCFDQRLLHRKEPACTAVCPTGSVIFGKRVDLLAKAKDRIAAAPGKYFEQRVYGEHEAGGTQVLYLSSVGFDKIGLPKLGTTSLGHYATKVTSVIYKWLSGPILLAGVLGMVIRKNWNRHEAERPEREKRTGFPEQL